MGGVYLVDFPLAEDIRPVHVLEFQVASHLKGGGVGGRVGGNELAVYDRLYIIE